MNAISFHPVHGTLATVGSDGRFSFWDKDARTKLKTSEQLDQPITACCFNHNGNIFAYASSYDWSKVGDVKSLLKCLYFITQVEEWAVGCQSLFVIMFALYLIPLGPWVLQPAEKELHLPKECRWGAEASEQEMVRGQSKSSHSTGLPHFLKGLMNHAGAWDHFSCVDVGSEDIVTLQISAIVLV